MAADGLKRRLEGNPAARELGRRLPPRTRRALEGVFGRRGRRRLQAERRGVAAFVESHASDVHGIVLEVGGSDFTHRFGGSRVDRSEILDIRADNALATIIADLSEPDSLPAGEFDCFLLLQALHRVPDARAALANAWHSLAPGGVLLVTVPLSSAEVLREPPFGEAEVRAHGGLVAGARLKKPND